MRSWPYIADATWVEKWQYRIGLLIAVMLPMRDLWVNIPLGIWVALWLLEKNPWERIRSYRFSTLHTPFLLILVYQIVMTISLVYTENTEWGRWMYERRLALPIISLMVLGGGWNKQYHLVRIAQAFILGNILVCAYLILTPLWEYITNPGIKSGIIRDPHFYFYNFLSYFKDRTFVTLNLIIASCLLLRLYGGSFWHKNQTMVRWIVAGWVAIFFAVILVSGSRSSLLAWILIMGGGLVYLLAKTGKKRVVFIVAAGVFLLIGTVVMFHPRFTDFHFPTFFEEENLFYIDPRIYIWETAWQVLQEHWLWGVGIGDGYDVMQGMDAHNVFLLAWIETGILGCLIWISLFASMVMLYKRERGLIIAFVAAFVIDMFFMSMLPRSYPMILLAFFLFWFYQMEKREAQTSGKVTNPTLSKWMGGITVMIFLATMVVYGYPLYGSTGLNPLDPSTFGFGRFSTVSSVAQRPEEVPLEAIGYKLDRTATAVIAMDRDNAHSYTLIGVEKMVATDTVQASVYAFVSPDFDGEQVQLMGVIDGQRVKASLYDLDRRAVWQKLSIQMTGLYGEIPISLYFKYSDYQTFEQMNGFVIFLYPLYQVRRADASR